MINTNKENGIIDDKLNIQCVLILEMFRKSKIHWQNNIIKIKR